MIMNIGDYDFQCCLYTTIIYVTQLFMLFMSQLFMKLMLMTGKQIIDWFKKLTIINYCLQGI